MNAVITEVIPIYTDPDGRMRLAGTRVLLDLVIHAYHRGETPEHIIQMYPTLTLEQVYLAIGYYLRHRSAVDSYLERMRGEADQHYQDWLIQQPDRIRQADLVARLNAKNRPLFTHLFVTAP